MNRKPLILQSCAALIVGIVAFRPIVAQATDQAISNMIQDINVGDEVTPGTIAYYIANIDPMGLPRVTGQISIDRARDWIEGQLNSLDGYYSVTRHHWEWAGYSGDNVVAERVGTSNPPDQQWVYILGAHYDSQPDSPGADDNGSGVACLLATARAIQIHNLTFPHTIRFVFFSGEEQGELGSHRYADDAAEDPRQRIAAVLNFDMAGHWQTENGRDKVRVYENTLSRWITDFMATVAQDYQSDIEACDLGYGLSVSRLLPYPAADHHAFSDHQSFWNQCYDAVSPHEYEQNENYHQPGDTLPNMQPAYAAKVARLSAATLAELAAQGATSSHPTCQALGCGTLVQGVECVLFQRDADGAKYVLSNYYPFEVGDRVYVSGIVDLSCATICMEGVGCVYDATLMPCPPNPSITSCGMLVQGVECLLFQAYTGGLYLLDNYDGFGAGDQVLVHGTLDRLCFTICMQGNGCIRDNTIAACPADFVSHGRLVRDGSCVLFEDPSLTRYGLSDLGGFVEGARVYVVGVQHGPSDPTCTTICAGRPCVSVSQIFSDSVRPCCWSDGACTEIAESTCRGWGGSPRRMAIDCTVPVCPPACPTLPGDLDGSGAVGFNDIQGFVNCLLVGPQLGSGCACADLHPADPDGDVDVSDMRKFMTVLLTW